MYSLMSAVLLTAALPCSRMRSVPWPSHRILMSLSGGGGGSEEPTMDWDRAWQRYRLEEQGVENEESTNPVADALASVLSAEAAREAARQDVEAAAAEKKRLEDELTMLEQKRANSLPWQFEELDELQRLIFDSGDKGGLLRLGFGVTAFLLLIRLLLELRVHGLDHLPMFSINST